MQIWQGRNSIPALMELTFQGNQYAQRQRFSFKQMNYLNFKFHLKLAIKKKVEFSRRNC